MNVAFMTHRGTVRDENQDAVFVQGIVRAGDMDAPEICTVDSTRPVLLTVVDGMGGRVIGALASEVVANTLAEETDKNKNIFNSLPNPKEDEQALVDLFAAAARRMGDEAEAKTDPAFSDMAAVVAGILLREKGGLVFNCGDSRVYRLRDSCLDRISHDHSVVQEFFEQNEISEDEMRTHYRKNIVTLAIASYLRNEIEIYAAEVTVCKGDTFFICSDGVWEALPSQELAALLAWNTSLMEAANKLFDTLINAKCRDNVSFIICRVNN